MGNQPITENELFNEIEKVKIFVEKSLEKLRPPVPSIGKLAEALSKAQGEFSPIKKSKTVDFTFNNQRTFYKYADLADVIAACQPALTKHGLAVIQTLEPEGQGLIMKTVLSHSSGEKVVSVYPLPSPLSKKPQAFGSDLTYARRYAYSAIVGVMSEEDDDGQISANTEPQKQQQSKGGKGKQKTQNASKTAEKLQKKAPEVSPEDKKLQEILKAGDWSKEQMSQYVQKAYGVRPGEKMTKETKLEFIELAMNQDPESAFQDLELAMAEEEPPPQESKGVRNFAPGAE